MKLIKTLMIIICVTFIFAFLACKSNNANVDDKNLSDNLQSTEETIVPLEEYKNIKQQVLNNNSFTFVYKIDGGVTYKRTVVYSNGNLIFKTNVNNVESFSLYTKDNKCFKLLNDEVYEETPIKTMLNIKSELFLDVFNNDGNLTFNLINNEYVGYVNDIKITLNIENKSLCFSFNKEGNNITSQLFNVGESCLDEFIPEKLKEYVKE